MKKVMNNLSTCILKIPLQVEIKELIILELYKDTRMLLASLLVKSLMCTILSTYVLVNVLFCSYLMGRLRWKNSKPPNASPSIFSAHGSVNVIRVCLIPFTWICAKDWHNHALVTSPLSNITFALFKKKGMRQLP